MRYHFTSPGMTIIIIIKWKLSVGKDVEELEPSYSAGGNEK